MLGTEGGMVFILGAENLDGIIVTKRRPTFGNGSLSNMT
jgi:hypothetical protein